MGKAPDEITRPTVDIGNSDAQKINSTFAPINSTDRPSTTSNKKSSKLRRRLGIKKLAILAGFIVIITIIGTLVYSALNGKGEQNASNQVKSVLSGDEMKDYSSPENKFTIKMPGFPSIKQSADKVDNKEIPITVYRREIENNSKTYLFEVRDYSKFNLDEKKALEAALNSGVQHSPGAKLTETKAGSYAGHNAIEGAYTITVKGKTSNVYVRYLIKDSKMYIALLQGADKSRFEEFANSLRLN